MFGQDTSWWMVPQGLYYTVKAPVIAVGLSGLLAAVGAAGVAVGTALSAMSMPFKWLEDAGCKLKSVALGYDEGSYPRVAQRVVLHAMLADLSIPGSGAAPEQWIDCFCKLGVQHAVLQRHRRELVGGDPEDGGELRRQRLAELLGGGDGGHSRDARPVCQPLGASGFAGTYTERIKTLFEEMRDGPDTGPHSGEFW